MNFKAIILAAGKGTRMKSKYPKVVHKVCGKEMVNHIIDVSKKSGVKDVVTILGHESEVVKNVLPKDTMIAMQTEQLGTGHAVKMAKEYAPFVRKIEVETENLDMVREAVEAGADIIMLDNMSVETMEKAIKLIAGRAETECSGNVTKENISRVTAVGVDYISSGALTHSAPILDISLKNLHAIE